MIRHTKHALEAMAKRGLAASWIEATVNPPDSVESDPRHPERTRSFKAIPELGSHALRVVHRLDGADMIIITAHLDRGAKR
jgi:hypothetical protein